MQIGNNRVSWWVFLIITLGCFLFIGREFSFFGHATGLEMLQRSIDDGSKLAWAAKSLFTVTMAFGVYGMLHTAYYNSVNRDD